LDRSDLVDIAHRACTLDELIETARLEARDDSKPVSEDAQSLERWVLAYAKGDRDALIRRLEWDSLTETAVLRALSKILNEKPGEPPSWMRPLEDLLPRYGVGDRGSPSLAEEPQVALFEPGEEPAFVELWNPFVLWARQRLLEMAPDALTLLEPRASRDLERHLVDQIVWTSGLAVHERFRRFLAEDGGPTTGADGRDGRVIYDRFLESMFRGGFVDFVKQFSGLARQLCRILETWLDAACELLRRLAVDIERIETTFDGVRPPGRLIRIQTDLSDPHNGGRRVLGLTFESGLRVIYKPRSVELEAAYNRFLGWLIEAGLESTPAPIRIISGEGYGWVEHVVPEPVATRDEVAEYFRRAGVLLCITHVLNASDLHVENVIARPGGPVVVDLETILQPRYRKRGPEYESGDQPGDPEPEVRDSFLDTGLLAAFQVDLDGRIQDIGGLTGGAPPTQHARRWTSINSDAMHPVWKRVPDPQRNVIVFRGEPQKPEVFADEITAGFTAAYRFLKDHRDAILSEDGPLSWFRGRQTRFVYRPSDVYAQVLYHLRTPRYQRDGLSQGLLIDSLNRVFSEQRSRPGVWPLVAGERRALQGLDVPYFTVPTDRSDVRSSDGETLVEFFDAAGLEIMVERLRDLDESDLERQLQMLTRVLFTPGDPATASAARARDSSKGSADEPDAEAPGDGGGCDPLVGVAASLAAEVRRVASEAADGSLTWVGREPANPQKDADPLDHVSLYNGDVGVLLFFAALARVTGNEVDRQTVLAGLPRIAAVFDGESGSDVSSPMALGACDGLGGIVYALTLIGILVDDPDAVRLALSVARRIDETSIASDTTFDVAGGGAGAILGLLALGAHTGEPWLVERAAACGDHLVSAAAPAPGEGLGWANPDGLMLAGLAHGAAGIGAALARLYEVTGRDVFRETAEEGYRYERSLFDYETLNWPLLRRPESDGEPDRIFMTTWCNGAPGIALARMDALGVIDGREVQAEIAVALEITERFGVDALDHLCCGNMGRVETFLTAGLKYGSVEFTRAAAMRTVMVVQRFLSTGSLGLHLPGTDGPDVVPGFFQGHSGIGYQLLRFVRPDLIPSVLMFQTPDAAGSFGEPG